MFIDTNCTSHLSASVILALAAFLLISITPTATYSQEVTLRIAHFFPPVHYFETEGAQYFKKRVDEMSKGDILVQTFPGGQIAKGPETLEAVQSGLTDLGFVIANMYSEDFPVAQVAQMPFLYESENSMPGAQALWVSLHEEGPIRREWEQQNVVPIIHFMTSFYGIYAKNKPVTSLADLKGMKVRSSPGAFNQTLQALGATPVNMSPGGSFTALQRGTLDAAWTFWSSFEGRNLVQVVKYATPHFSRMSGGFNPVVMDKSRFCSLSDKHREILVKAGRETTKHLQEIIISLEDKLENKYRDSDKLTINSIPDDEIEKMKEAVQPVYNQYFKTMSARGLNGQQILDHLKERIHWAQNNMGEFPEFDYPLNICS